MHVRTGMFPDLGRRRDITSRIGHTIVAPVLFLSQSARYSSNLCHFQTRLRRMSEFMNRYTQIFVMPQNVKNALDKHQIIKIIDCHLFGKF